MYGLDTNILLRLITADDERQKQEALDLIERYGDDGEFLISSIVLCEFVWTLSRTFQYSKNGIVSALELILQIKTIKFIDEDEVLEAIILYLQSSFDFSDILIGLIHKSYGLNSLLHSPKKLPNLHYLNQ